jgi:hypothetical protein
MLFKPPQIEVSVVPKYRHCFEFKAVLTTRRSSRDVLTAAAAKALLRGLNELNLDCLIFLVKIDVRNLKSRDD